MKNRLKAHGKKLREQLNLYYSKIMRTTKAMLKKVKIKYRMRNIGRGKWQRLILAFKGFQRIYRLL